MALSRDEVGKGLVVELEGFERLVRSLSPTEMTRTTRCEGWTVADVAAHLIGTMADITQGRIEGQGTPEATEGQVVERRGRPAAELADELRQAADVTPGLLAAFDDDAWGRPAPGGYDMTLGEAVEALWYDAYVHADDIRAAAGRPTERTDGLKASVSHVADLLTRKGWGPATLALDGLPEFTVGVGDGRGHRIEGDPFEFLLAATGRAEPAVLGLDATVNVYA